MGTRNRGHPEDGNRRDPDQDAQTERRGVVPSSGAGSLALRPVESSADPGRDRVDEGHEVRDVMEESDHHLACEPGAIRARAVPLGPTRQKKKTTKLHATCRTGVGARHAWLDLDEATNT